METVMMVTSTDRDLHPRYGEGTTYTYPTPHALLAANEDDRMGMGFGEQFVRLQQAVADDPHEQHEFWFPWFIGTGGAMRDCSIAYVPRMSDDRPPEWLLFIGDR